MPGKGKRFRKGSVWAVTGDLEWFASEFGFPYAASNLLCGYCLADQNFKDSTMPFTDFRPQAAWRKSCLTPEQLQETSGDHPLLRLGCTSPLGIKLDVLHVLDLGGFLLAWVSPHFRHEPAGREDQQLGSAFSIFPWVKAMVYMGHKKVILWQQTTKEKETSKP